MPAGDLITGDFQCELRALLMGDTTNYPIVDIDGISLVPIVRNDLPKLLADGVFQGLHTRSSRVITVTMNVKGTTAANLESRMATLETAWDLASAADIDFVIRFGGVKKKCTGRPINFDRGRFTASSAAAFTQFGVRGQFEAGTPTWTTI